MTDPNTSQESSFDKTTQTGQQAQPSVSKSSSLETFPSDLSGLQTQGVKKVLRDLARDRAIAEEVLRNVNFDRQKGIIGGQLIGLNAAYWGIVTQYPDIISGGIE
jgi:hypothetical protein